jgi:hypothetical protein
MKVPHLRAVCIAAATTALAVGLSATAADAFAATSSHTAHTTTSAPAASLGTITSTVTGTFTNADGTGNFAGTFVPQKFAVVNGVLDATGLLKGTLTDANGTQLGTVDQTATIPVNTTAAAADPGCNILNLTLGPLNLNLLGLVVTLNEVHLTITAVPGVGNLLGNLLCDVAGLLNGGGALSEISALLNSILALL